MKIYPHTFSGRRASQSEYELKSLIEFLKNNSVKRYLEIGARDGDTFHEIVSSINPDYALAVDLVGGLWGKITTEKKLINAIHDLKKKSYNVELLLGDSQSEEVIQYISNIEKFDAVFIDADHTLEGVTKDWNNYKQVADIVIFHDIIGSGQKENVFGNIVEVPILWENLKKEYDHIEFIDEDSKMGIGVIFI